MCQRFHTFIKFVLVYTAPVVMTACGGGRPDPEPGHDTHALDSGEQCTIASRESPVESSPARSLGTQGMGIYRDPVTGEIGSPPASTYRVSSTERGMLQRSCEGLKSRVLPNGTTVLDLQGRFMGLSVARKNPDDTISTACFHSADPAEKFLAPEVSERVTPEVTDVR